MMVKTVLNRRYPHLLLIPFLMMLALAGCGSGDVGTATVTLTNNNSNSASGAVTTVTGSAGDGPITGGSVTVTNANGIPISTSPSHPLTTATAHYSFTVPSSTPVPLIITVSKGNDIVTTKIQDFDLSSVAADPLVAGSTIVINVNPLSTLVEASARATGSINATSVADAVKHLRNTLSFGLPANVDPIKGAVTDQDIAVVIKANEAAAEMIRRVNAASTAKDIKQTILSIADDITDEVIDGQSKGVINSYASATMAAIILNKQSDVSAQVIADNLEITDPLDSSKIRVAGNSLTTKLNQAITTSSPTIATNLADVTKVIVTTAFINQTTNALGLVNSLTGAQVSDITQINKLNAAITAITQGTVPTAAQKSDIVKSLSASASTFVQIDQYATQTNIGNKLTAAIKLPNNTVVTGHTDGGPVSGASISAVDIYSKAVVMTPSAPRTDIYGNFLFEIPAHTASPLLIKVSGGTDILTGAPQGFAFKTATIVSTSVRGFAISNANALSTIIVQSALALGGGVLNEANLSASTTHVMDTLGFGLPAGINPISTRVDPSNAAAFAKANTAVGILIHNVSQSSGLALTDVIVAIGEDLTDGVIDGKSSAGVVATQPLSNIASTVLTTRAQINATNLFSSITLHSSNGDPSKVRVGDTITIAFSSNSPLTSLPTVTIGGTNVPVTADTTTANSYSAVYTINKTTPEGGLAFVITNGRTSNGSQVTQSTDGSVIVVDRTAPTVQAQQGVVFSSDSGASANDHRTSTPSQTLTITLSGTLSAGDRMFGSLDGGINWIDITNKVHGTSVNWDGVTLLDGSHTLQLKVSDAAGNDGPVTSVAYVLDKIAPTFNALPLTTLTIEATGSNTSHQLVAPAASDNYGAVAVVANHNNIFPLGTTTVTWSATDQQGMSATASQQVLVEDTTKPTLSLPASMTVSAQRANGVDATAAAIHQFLISSNATDLVDGAITTISNNAPTVFPIGTTVVTFSVSDTAGNSASASASITVKDQTAPVVHAPHGIAIAIAATATTIAATDPQIAAFLSAANATDQVDGLLSTVSNNAPNTFPLGITTVLFTATDSAGNSASAVSTVIVQSVAAPKVHAPTNITVEATGTTGLAKSSPDISIYLAAVSALDAYGNLVVDKAGKLITTFSNNAPTTFPLGTTTVVFSLTDSYGNIGSNSSTVTVEDTTAPVITLVGNNPDTIEVGQIYTDAGATAYDVVDGYVTAITTINPVSTTRPNAYTVSYFVSDQYGNRGSAIRSVKVVDSTPPVISGTPLADLYIEATAPFTPYTLVAPTASDSYGVAQVVNNHLTAFPLGVSIVTWTATDYQGLQSTASQQVIIQDTTPPTITPPNNITVASDGAAGTAITSGNIQQFLSLVSASDAVDGAITTISNNAPGIFPIGSTTVVFTASDAAGNSATSSATVTVRDQDPPAVTAPQGIVVGIAAGSNGASINNAAIAAFLAGASAIDGVDGTISTTNNAPVIFPIGATSVLFSASDAAGNRGSAIATVIVQSVAAPVITAPGNVTIEATDRYGTARAAPSMQAFLGSISATNAFGAPLPAITNNAPTTLPLGVTTVTFNVTDSYGNIGSNTSTVIVTDATKPQLTLKGMDPYTIEVGQHYMDAGATATDSVDGDLSSAIITVNPVHTFFPSTFSVDYFVTDAHGNRATTLHRTVHVVDTTPPVFSALPLTDIYVEATGSLSSYALITPTAQDNYGMLSVTADNRGPFPLGVSTITWTATDKQGLHTMVSQRIIMRDTTAPTLSAPANITVAAQTASGTAATVSKTVIFLAGASASDSVDGTITAISNDAPSIFPLGTTTVTFSVQDAAGNSTSATANVTVTDQTAPVVTPPSAIIVGVAANAPGAANTNTLVASFLSSASATDSVDGTISSITNNAPGVFPMGLTTVTFSASDLAGNVGKAVATVVVQSVALPQVTAASPIIVEATGASGAAKSNPVITTFLTGSSARDVHGNVITTISNNAPSQFPLGVTTVTFSATDIYSNVGSNTATVTVVDSTGPVISLKGSDPYTVEVGQHYIDAGATAYDVVDGYVTANITTINPVITTVPSTFTVRYLVSDSYGNASTQAQRSVKVVDTTPPVIANTPLADLYIEASGVLTPYALAVPTVNDNYGVVSVVNDHPTAFPLGITPVTWRVTDKQGLTASAVQQVIVRDTTPPALIAPSDTTIAADTSAGTAKTAAAVVQFLAAAVATDWVDGNISAIDNNAPTLLPIGSTTITFTVRDSRGNSNSVTAQITVADQTPPVITPPQGIVVGVANTAIGAQNSNTAIAAFLNAATATDNVDGTISVTAIAPTVFALGATTVTFKATDAAGNSSSAIGTVTVQAIAAPTITAPANIVVEAQNSSGTARSHHAVVTFLASASAKNAFGVALTPVTNDAASTLPLGTSTITFTVTDSYGNTGTNTSTITIDDSTAPVISLSGIDPITVEVGQQYNDAGATAYDVVDGYVTTKIVTVNPVVTGKPATFVVRYDVADSQGNAASHATRTVQVVDTTPPVISGTPLQDIYVEATGVTTPYTLLTPIATDNYGVVSVVNDHPIAFPFGVTVVTWTATDKQGLTATTSQQVVVRDTIAPQITTPANIVVAAHDASGVAKSDAAIAQFLSAATATDQVDGTIATISNDAPQQLPLGTTTITFHAVDSAGNSRSATATITVKDQTAPVVTAPTGVIVGVDANAVGAIANDPTIAAFLQGAVAVDSVDGTITTISNNAPGTFAVGSTLVRFSATDAAGNQGSATATVIVQSVAAPTITVPNNITVEAQSAAGTAKSNATITTYLGNAIARDGFSNLLTPISNNAPTTFPIGTTTVTFSATDSYSNTGSNTSTVTVVDTTAPVITILGNNPYTIEAGQTFVDPGATAADSVDGDVTAAIVAANSVSTAAPGTYHVSYHVTDSYGNVASVAKRTVAVVDTTPPVISGTPLADLYIEATGVTTPYALLIPSATDNYGIASVVHNHPAPFPLGVTTVTWTATDKQGLTSLANQKVVVRDTTAPDLRAPANITVAGQDSYGTPQSATAIAVFLARAAASDLVDGIITTISNNAPTTFLFGTTAVTFTVTDAAGNQNTASASVTVADQTPPVVTAPQGIVVGIAETATTALATDPYIASFLTGATAVDSHDGIITTITSDATTIFPLGATKVIFSAADSYGNIGTAPSTVTVQSVAAPTITAPVNLTVEATSAAGVAKTATAIVNYLAAASAKNAFNVPLATVSNDAPALLPLGDTTITFQATDSYTNIGSNTSVITVEDTTAPIITRNGIDPYTIEVGLNYVDAGATAYDVVDGYVTSAISTINPVVTTAPAVFTVRYLVNDSYGNAATSVHRTVNVVDTTPPVINGTPLADIYVDATGVTTPYALIAPSVSDNYGIASITADNTGPFSVGSTTITWTATDKQGLTASTSQRLIVKLVRPITILGNIALSADTGVSSSDFYTNQPSQTISATLSVSLAAGENLYGSVDSGTTWSNITNKVATTALTWNGITLNSGSHAIQFKVTNAMGNDGPVSTQNYTLDTTAPTIVSHTPAANATNLALDSTIDITFSEAMASTTLTTTSLSVVSLRGTALTGSVTVGSSAITASFVHGALATNTRYTVTASSAITDLAGNTLAASSWNFVTVNGTTWKQQAFVKAANAGSQDRFGWSVSIDGNTLAVAALFESSNQTTITNGTGASADNSLSNSGAVYVYQRTGTTWAQQAYIKAVNADAWDKFGMSVTISGDTLAVGTRRESSNQTTITNGTGASADNSVWTSGAVYVYQRTGTVWVQQAYIKAVNAKANDLFGHSVSINGNTLTVGAINENSKQTTITNGTGASADNSFFESGAVYVYQHTGTTWAQQAYIKATNAGPRDKFGQSVDIYADTLVVGAYGEDSNQSTITNGMGASADNSSSDSGAVYVYQRTGTNWAQQAYIKASNNSNGRTSDWFGYSVTISGETLAVGAFIESSNQTTITNGAGASADTSLYSSGAVYVYQRTGTTWAQQAYIKAANAGASDQFGMSVDLYADTLAVGAIYEDSNQTTITNGTGASADNSLPGSGAVYVYQRTGTTWAQQAYIKAVNAGASDWFGHSVSIDGDTLAVGALFEDSNQTTITNGTGASADNSLTSSGAVYVYQRSVSGSTTNSLSGLALSADTGVSSSDFYTNQASQTITATLSTTLSATDAVFGSLDGGASWSNLTNSISATTLTWSGVTLTGSNTLKLKVTDSAGNSGTVLSQAYVLDTTVPANFSALALSADTGSSSTDFITNTAAQTITATLSTALAASDIAQGSLDNGTTWTDITSKVSGTTLTWNGVTLTASNTLKLKMTDKAGNSGTVLSQAYVLDTTAPASFSALALSADTGISSTDFITKTAAQTITATLSAALATSDIVQGSLDNGATWTDITNKVSGTSLSWGITLTGNNTLKLKVTDTAGNSGTVLSQAYVLDTTAPANFSAVALSADTGSSSTDFITNTAAQTITATLSTGLAAGDIVKGSLDNGTTWTDITSKISGTSLTWNGVTLTASNTLKLKITDKAGNGGTVLSQAYVLDTTAPASFSALAFSADTGISSTDFITKTAAQTITATLSAGLATSDVVQGSLDNGATWTDITAKVSGTTLTWNSITLTGNNTLKLKVTDTAGNSGTVLSQAYLFSTTAIPLSTVAIASNNANSTALAKAGDVVTVSFSASKALYAMPTVTIAGHTATVANGTTINSYTAAYTMVSGDSQGSVAFAISFTDAAGNVSTAVTTTTNSTAVSFDSVAPTIVSHTPAANATSTALDSTIDITFSEAMASTTLTTTSLSVVSLAGTALSGSVTVASGGTKASFVHSGLAAYTRYTVTASGAITDAAGNALAVSSWDFVTVNTVWKQQAFVKASNAGWYDHFGYSVTINGDTLAVSADQESSNQTTITNGTGASADNSLIKSGAVYVYQRTGTTWTQQAYIKAANVGSNDGFGVSVSVSGNTLAVGANGEDSNQTTITNGTGASADNSLTLSGAVYVYQRTGTTWAQQAYIKATNVGSVDEFGWSVDLYADTLAVGALFEGSNQTTITNGTGASTDNSLGDSGAVYVYQRTGTAWTQQAYIKAVNAGAGDRFGYSVSLNGNTLAVGATNEDSNQSTITNGTTVLTNDPFGNPGAVYVYQRTGATWVQQAYIKAANVGSGDTFGQSVTISGNTLAVGAFNEDSNQTTITNGTGASADNSLTNSGAVYVYQRTGATWVQQAYIKATNASSSDNFGAFVSINNDTLAVGSNYESSNQTTITNGTSASADNSLSNSGAVYVYQRTGTTWAQQAYIKAANVGNGDQFGRSVDLYADTLAVGAMYEDSNQTTITNGTGASANNSVTDSGAVYIYQRSILGATSNSLSGLALSADTGSSSSDFYTNQASQTITATLSSALSATELLFGSLDGGTNWSNLTSSVSATTLTWSSVTLTGNNTLKLKVTDTAGNSGTVLSQAYVLDTTAPAQSFSALAFSADTGSSSTDFITKTAAQTITATLSAGLAAGDIVNGSLDGGTTWTDITNKVSGTSLTWNGVTLTASNTLKLKMTDKAGNSGTALSQAYVLDSTAPASFSALAFSADSGISSDFITKTAAQTITATLSTSLATGDVVQGSLDNGSTWTDITNKVTSTSLSWNGVTLTGNSTLKLKTTDTAGNVSTVLSQAYQFDTTAPTLSSVTIASNNTNTAKAKTGDVITISFTASEALSAMPTATIAGQTATVSNGGTVNSYSAAYTTLSGATQGTVALAIAFSDVAGNVGTTVTATTNSSSVFLDSMLPTLSSVTIASNNANSTALAKAGDVVTVSFTTSEALSAMPTATIAGKAATVSNGTTVDSYTAAYTMVSNDTQGTVALSIAFTDAAGNAGTAVTATSDSSAVSFDSAVPTLTSVTIASNNADTTRAKTGDKVTVSFTASEALYAMPTATIATKTATVANGTAADSYTAAYTMTSSDTEGAVSLSIAFSDAAGNAGTAVTTTSDNSAVTFDRTAPTISTKIPAASATGVTDAATVSVTFSEAMDTTTITHASFTVTPSGGSAAAGVLSFNSSGNTVATLTPSLKLAPSTLYTVSIGSGMQDLAGNAIAATSWTWTTQPSFPRFAYAVNFGSNTLSIYTVDGATGQLRHNGYVATGTSPRSVAVDPYGRFAYVTNLGDHTLSAYAINATTGRLTTVSGSPFATTTSPEQVTVDPSGQFAYVADATSNDVYAYVIDQTSGALTSAGTKAAGTSPRAVTVDPYSRFVYVTNAGGGNVSAYTIDPSSGALTVVGAANAGTSPRPVTVDPYGKFAYVGNQTSNDVSIYTINQSSGALNELTTGSPVATGLNPMAVTVEPSGRFAYVANNASQNIYAYTINSTTGALTPLTTGSVVASTTGAQSVTVDRSGKFAYAVGNNSASHDIYAYTINGTTGELTLASTISTQSAPAEFAIVNGATAVSYVPKFAYVANANSNTISTFKITASTGALGTATSTVSITNPKFVTVDPYGRFAYAVSSSGNDVYTYTINASTGVLTAVGAPVATGGHPEQITVDPSSRFVYVANTISKNVYAYAINQTSGALTAVSGSPFTTLTNIGFIAMDPSGRFAYMVGDNTANNVNKVYVYTIDAGTGTLTALTGTGSAPATGANPLSVAVSPSGKFVYVPNNNGNTSTVSTFSINPSTGALTAVGTAITTGSTGSNGIAIDPYGRFAYTSNWGGNVSAFTINQTTGALGSVTGSPFSANSSCRSVAVDPSGKFVYVTNSGSSNVSAYTIDQTTGVLSPMTPATVTTGSGPNSIIVSGVIQ